MAKDLAQEEADGGNPVQAALAAGVTTAVGAFIPVVPFFWSA